MTLLHRLFARRPDPREEVRPLWRRVVALGRDPHWYRVGGAADTLEGRFDMISAVLALVMIRMERSATLAPLAGPLTEIFVEEMDGQLRQTGVGDLMVGKQIGRLMATLGGRLGAYRTALTGSDGGALAQAVRRNVTLSDDAQAGATAERLRKLAARLDAASDEALLAGDIA